ncbi:MAG TPA: adenylate/guanylate cyclase domain-containing protein [Acidimicrobiia bacterium]|nr:adenylate/guanylate cyclase domain-containing protein [Acidimicrobiia bacterium]
MSELPTGTVTFLFTDLEGSTRLWEEHPDAMQAALARHDEILRDAIATHDGHVVKMTGDGVHAAFTTAADALEAAAAAQRALYDEAWGITGPLKVRMGLHTCEAELRDGDYYGSAVNRAARLMSIAHGGQVVLSTATGELARERELEVVDLGEHRLRDLSRRERVWQLCPTGLDREFPPLRSLDEYPSNLPSRLSSFVGRTAEIEQLLADLDHNRIVTLTGVGGVGKTRLAVQTCAEALPHFPDGAWFVDLAPVRDREQVAATVASVLGVKERPGEELAVTLRDALRERRAIILLDNGEHLVDDLADLLQELLHRPVAAKFLITTREPLGIDGEQVRRVASLGEADASELFVQRATSVRPDVDWSGFASEITAVCEQLDGIPLAVELAAARTSSMLPPEILQRLGERFRLLSGSRRSARERHQTLLAAVDWSYDLLTEQERSLFNRLAVFRGGFYLEAVEAICTGGIVDEFDVVDLLDRLVDKSMVLAMAGSARTSYRLLETLRQYAESKLAVSGESDAYRDRHVAHFVQHATEWGPRNRTADQRAVVAQLLADRPNLNAMLDRLFEQEQWSDIARVCASLGGFWSTMAPEDGRRWYLLLERAADELPSDEAMSFLAFGAYVLENCGFPLDAARFADRAIALAERAGVDPPAEPFYSLAWRARSDGRPEEAIALAQRGAELATKSASAWLNLVIRSQGCSALVEIDPQAGILEAADLGALADETGVPTFVAATSFGYGWALALGGRRDEAEPWFARATERAQGNSIHVEVSVLLSRGLLAVDDDQEVALDLLRRAIDQGEAHGVLQDVLANAYEAVAWIWIQDGRAEDAAVLMGAVGAVRDAIGASGDRWGAARRDAVRTSLTERFNAAELDRLLARGRVLSRDEMRRFALGADA